MPSVTILVKQGEYKQKHNNIIFEANLQNKIAWSLKDKTSAWGIGGGNVLKSIKMKKALKNFKKSFHLIIILISAILLWRGIWGLTDNYLFPDNKPLSNIVSIVLGVILLKLTHISIKNIE